MTTHRAYSEAVEGNLSANGDYAQFVRLYAGTLLRRLGLLCPAECTGTEKVRIEGNPDKKHVSAPYAERSNLTIRMNMRRFTRLTNMFSQKVENHAYAVALHMMYYNFVRIHKTLRVTPAKAAGLSDRLWEIDDIAKLVENAEELARGPYRKRPPVSLCCG